MKIQRTKNKTKKQQQVFAEKDDRKITLQACNFPVESFLYAVNHVNILLNIYIGTFMSDLKPTNLQKKHGETGKLVSFVFRLSRNLCLILWL